MQYISTRGQAPAITFLDAILRGLAPDGGLYVPQTYPRLSPERIERATREPYSRLATDVLIGFAGGDLTPAEAAWVCQCAYDFDPAVGGLPFAHQAVAPLVEIGAGEFMMELFHGPTLAFKDIAMRMIAPLMDLGLARTNSRATVICATSGDTGGAAVSAFAHRERSDLFVLYPKGRISDVQRRFMTTQEAPNVHCLEVDADFDAAQAMVKALLADRAFAGKVSLSAVNSINWARILAQSVYFLRAGAILGATRRAVSFTVPTGNFGDALAGYVAARMGLPVDRIISAVNANDVLARLFARGRLAPGASSATLSPAMDIQVPSNVERLLFELSGRNADLVREIYADLAKTGSATVPEDVVSALKTRFDVGSATDQETADMIAIVKAESGQLIDPHTSVGVNVGRRLGKPERGFANVILSTAHPAKFPQTVREASGYQPELPEHARSIMTLSERFTPISTDLEGLKQLILSRARAVGA